MTFTDTICLNDNVDENMCMGSFQFYPISSQSGGLSAHQDGIIGLAPHQDRKHHYESFVGPLLLHELKKAGVIDRSMIAMFIADQHKKRRSIQIGDYDANEYVDGGDTNMHWYSLLVASNGEWRWQTDLTHAKFGDQKLFTTYFQYAELNAGYAGIGLTEEDYSDAVDILKEKIGKDEIHCDEERCLLKEKCEDYQGEIPDLHLKLSNRE